MAHERTELILGLKMDESMNMVGHNHKAKTFSLLVTQLGSKEMDNDPLRTVFVQQPASPVTGKGHEMRVAFIVEDFTRHGSMRLLIRWDTG